MCFLLKMCVLLMITTEFTIIGGEHCQMSSSKTTGKCQDWKKMSVLVADLIGGRSVVDKPETKPNMLTLLIRAASGVIGRGARSLNILIVNGLMLLTQTILAVSKSVAANKTDNNKYVAAGGGGRPIDWILNNSYIKSTIEDATDENLPDRLERLASGMPCVQLLMCRLSPIVHGMQRRVKERWGRPTDDDRPTASNASDWQLVKRSAKHCRQKHSGCDQNN